MAFKSAINMLQELMVAKNHPLPQYSYESVGNEIEPKFNCTVTTVLVAAVGVSRNKKEAKQLAAENALRHLGYKVESAKTFVDKIILQGTEPLAKDYVPRFNYIGQLNEYASTRHLGYPVYDEDLFAVNGQFKVVCKFKGVETEGYAPTKKQAKQIASYKMIACVKSGKISTVAPEPAVPKPGVQYTERDFDIMKKFEEISMATKKSPLIEPNIKVEEKVYTIEEAKTELAKWNIEYELKEIQEDPYMVSFLRKDKSMTLLGTGSTNEEATINVLNEALGVLRGGSSGVP